MHHCATYSKQLWEPMRQMGDSIPGATVYDPMAGIGTVADVFPDFVPRGCEIEPEYAVRPWIEPINCLQHSDAYLFICTSPPYGNRMADQYLGTPEEKELRSKTGKRPRRQGYAIDLNRKVSPGSSAGLQWGPKYRSTMTEIWQHIVNVNLRSRDGYLLVNVGSSFKNRTYQPVAEWTLQTLMGMDVGLVDYRFVETPGNRDGQNRELRVGGEHLYLFRKGVW